MKLGRQVRRGPWPWPRSEESVNLALDRGHTGREESHTGEEPENELRMGTFSKHRRLEEKPI